MSIDGKSDPRDEIELKNPENLYQIKDENGQIINYKEANGRQLFNHYRHNMTNYDEVLDDIQKKQGYVSGYQQKKAVTEAAEQVISKYREEHTKVIQDAQIKRNILKKLLEKAKVGTASALVNLFDDWSEKIKDIAKLKKSQGSLQTWNDTYRVQRELVKKLLQEADILPEVRAEVNAIYSTKSVNKAVEKGCDIFALEKSEILKIVKKAIRYSKFTQQD